MNGGVVTTGIGLPGYAWQRADLEHESKLGDARVDNGLTVTELCAAAGVSATHYHQLNSGLASPLDKRGNIKAGASRLAEVLGVSVPELWPRYVCGIERPRGDDPRPEDLRRASWAIEPDPDPHEEAEKSEARSLLAETVAGLSPREQQVLALRFGGDMTIEEVGAELGVSGERVRQIISKALRRMRHPARLSRLRELAA